MKLLDRLSNKGKLNILTLIALSGGIVLTVLTISCAIDLVQTKSAIDFNKYNTAMSVKFQEDYTKVKSDLTSLINSEVDSVSISTIYYLFSQSGKDYVITSVVTSEVASTVITLDESMPPVTEKQPQSLETPVTGVVAEQPQSPETTVTSPQTQSTGTPVTEVQPQPLETPVIEGQPQSPETLTTGGQPQSTETPATDAEKVDTVKLPQKNKTGNSPVIISFRGDVKGVLSYLDKTKLNYTILSYFSHNNVNSCTLEVRR